MDGYTCMNFGCHWAGSKEGKKRYTRLRCQHQVFLSFFFSFVGLAWLDMRYHRDGRRVKSRGYLEE